MTPIEPVGAVARCGGSRDRATDGLFLPSRGWSFTPEVDPWPPMMP